MNLLVDLGNTRFKWAYTGEPWRPRAQSYESEPWPDCLERAWPTAPRRMLVANVAGAERESVLAQWARRRWGLALEPVRPVRDFLGVRNLYSDPARLGADRWAALIAARAQVAADVCVVSCGTAITVDALSGGGEFLGGVIIPGVNAARACLRAQSALIKETDGAEDSCLARDTGSAVAAGTLFGATGAIERALDEQQARLHAKAQVLVSGGDAERLAPLLRRPVSLAPDLVLRGLAMIAEATA